VLVGSVPLVGDLFDMGFKANRRNVDLLSAHVDDPEGVARGSLLRVLTVALVLVALLLLLGVLAWQLLALVLGAVGGWLA